MIDWFCFCYFVALCLQAAWLVLVPEIWKAQLQLLPGFISSDVVGGGAPLKLRKHSQMFTMTTQFQQRLCYLNAESMFFSSQTLQVNRKTNHCSATTISWNASRWGVYMTLCDRNQYTILTFFFWRPPIFILYVTQTKKKRLVRPATFREWPDKHEHCHQY